MHACSYEIERTGTYRHTAEELTWGARVAWRNASRCIGRLYWHSLQVRDLPRRPRRRRVAEELLRPSARHLARRAHPPDDHRLPRRTGPDGSARPHLERPAHPVRGLPGRRRRSGTGSTPASRDSRSAWVERQGRPVRRPAAGDRDAGRAQLHPLPEDAVEEVPILHPDFAWFAELGLRWHAVPAISNMRLEIGGVSYGAAPFNGWYMQTEIAARNLVDAHRYDVLPAGRRVHGAGHVVASGRCGGTGPCWSSIAPCCTPSTRRG